uniref:Uncharacterized protein n=1 Tax=Glossina austeni TaxID=7395 RepID=A0A1A9UJP7_GLOAU
MASITFSIVVGFNSSQQLFAAAVTQMCHKSRSQVIPEWYECVHAPVLSINDEFAYDLDPPLPVTYNITTITAPHIKDKCLTKSWKTILKSHAFVSPFPSKCAVEQLTYNGAIKLISNSREKQMKKRKT